MEPHPHPPHIRSGAFLRSATPPKLQEWACLCGCSCPCPHAVGPEHPCTLCPQGKSVCVCPLHPGPAPSHPREARVAGLPWLSSRGTGHLHTLLPGPSAPPPPVATLPPSFAFPCQGSPSDTPSTALFSEGLPCGQRSCAVPAPQPWAPVCAWSTPLTSPQAPPQTPSPAQKPPPTAVPPHTHAGTLGASRALSPATLPLSIRSFSCHFPLSLVFSISPSTLCLCLAPSPFSRRSSSLALTGSLLLDGQAWENSPRPLSIQHSTPARLASAPRPAPALSPIARPLLIRDWFPPPLGKGSAPAAPISRLAD